MGPKMADNADPSQFPSVSIDRERQWWYVSLLTVFVVSAAVHVVVSLPLWCHLEGLNEDDSNDHETKQCWEDNTSQCNVRIRCEATAMDM